MTSILRYLLIFIISFSSKNIFGANKIGQIKNQWEDLYKKATVATFYSATVLNGFDELKLANLYLDSARALLNDYPQYKGEFKDEYLKLNALQKELEGSRSIAEDNLNYIYPPFSLMMGERPEFNERDDAEELLLENLLDKIFDLNDPINKGKIRDNTDFVLVGIYPFDRNLFLVVNDFFGTETGHYAIRYHELKKILTPEGFERYQNNKLDKTDLDAICEAYSISKLLYFQFVDQGSVIPNLFYKGVYLNTYEKGQSTFEFQNYYEGFRVDKSDSWTTAIIILLINIVFTGLILYLKLSLTIKIDDRKKFSLKKYKIYYIFSDEKLKAAVILLLSGIVSAVLTNVLTASFPVGINEFYGSPISNVWVLSQIFIPLLITSIIGYLAINKFTKIPVNSISIYSGLIYSAILSQLSVQSYFEYHSEFFSQHIFFYLVIIPGITMAFTTIIIGKAINGLIKGARVHLFTKILTPIIILGCVFANWLVLRQLFVYSNLTFIFLMIFALIPIIRKSLLFKFDENIFAHSSLSNSFFNPSTWIQSGLNINELKDELNQFISSNELDSNHYLIIEGHQNIGKSRLLSEIFSDVEYVFTADCSLISKEESTFNWFNKAFIDNSNYQWFDRGFFKDRSAVTNKLESVVKLASSMGPVDVSNILSAGDNKQKSEEEIANEFLDIIESQYIKGHIPNHDNKVIIIIDGFESIGDLDFKLLLTIVQQLKIRKKLQQKIKIIISYHNNIGADKTEKNIDELNNIIEYQIPKKTLQLINLIDWLTTLTSSSGVQIFEDNTPVVFDYNLKQHLQTITEHWKEDELMPGDVLMYLENLFLDKFLAVQYNKAKLIQIPPEDKYVLKNHAFKAAEDALGELSIEDRKILESAAHIGLKFDANILAEIWNVDILTMLEKLIKFENVFIIDVSEEDNIYRFKERKIQDLLISESMQNTKDGRVRQLIIEYQKRIIRTILKLENFNTVSTDLLRSSFDRCIRFKNVPFLAEYIEFLGYETALKYSEQTNSEELKSILTTLYNFNPNPNNENLNRIIRALKIFSDFENINNINFEIRGEKYTEIIFRLIRKKFNSNEKSEDQSYQLFLSLFLKDVFNVLKKFDPQLKDEKEEYISQLKNGTGLEGEIIAIAQLRANDVNKSQTELDFECRFYLTLILEIVEQTNSAEVLPMLLKDGLSNEFYRISGYISRHLSLNRNNKRETLAYCYIALNCLLENKVSLKDVLELEISEKEILKTVKELVNDSRLSRSKIIDLNYTIGRLRDFYSTLQKWDTVIWISELGKNISDNLNDSFGVYLNQNSLAISHFNLGNIDECENIYKDLFHYQLKKKHNPKDYIYILEGLLYVGLEKKNFDSFEDAKKEMYEHLMILSNKILTMPLEFSAFNKTKSLQDLLDSDSEIILTNNNISLIEDDKNVESNVSIHNEDIQNILSVFIALACSDEDLDGGELFDLKETSYALAIAMGIPSNLIVTELEKLLKQYIKKGSAWNKDKFVNGFDWIVQNKTSSFSSSILQLLRSLASADGEYEEVEKELITKAKNMLKHRLS